MQELCFDYEQTLIFHLDKFSTGIHSIFMTIINEIGLECGKTIRPSMNVNKSTDLKSFCDLICAVFTVVHTI